MASLSNAVQKLGEMDTVKDAATVTGGFLLADTVAPGVVDRILGMVGVDAGQVPEEAYGAVVAVVFYAYGAEAMKKGTADMVALGGLVKTVDALLNRFGVRGMIAGTMEGGA